MEGEWLIFYLFHIAGVGGSIQLWFLESMSTHVRCSSVCCGSLSSSYIRTSYKYTHTQCDDEQRRIEQSMSCQKATARMTMGKEKPSTRKSSNRLVFFLLHLSVCLPACVYLLWLASLGHLCKQRETTHASHCSQQSKYTVQYYTHLSVHQTILVTTLFLITSPSLQPIYVLSSKLSFLAILSKVCKTHLWRTSKILCKLRFPHSISPPLPSFYIFC